MVENHRPLTRVIRAVSGTEGEDMPIRRAFAAHGNVFIDPFIMLDHFGPSEIGPDSRGFPPHPHKGFETVTYMLSGEIEHRDSTGGHAVIGPGDVQWMTAGGGIVHSETPPEALKQSGGTVEGLQIWVNLPRANKETPAGYQILKADDLGHANSEGVKVKVLAGDLLGVEGPARTHSPMTVAVLRLGAGSTVTLDPSPHAHAALYVARGALKTEGSDIARGHTAVFEAGAGQIALAASEDTLVLYMCGDPIGEPVVARGPFVMTTEGEVRQAMMDYQAGKFGPAGMDRL